MVYDDLPHEAAQALHLGPGDIHVQGHPELLLGYFLPGAVAGVALEGALHAAQKLLNASPSQAVRAFTRDWRYALYVYSGRSAVYRGVGGNLLAGGLWSGMFGSVYVPVKKMVEEQPDLSPASQQLLGPAAAAIAGSLAASTVRTPLEVVRQTMLERGWRSSTRTFTFLTTRLGTSSLYRSWGSSVLKGMPLDALLFCVYEGAKAHVEQQQQGRGVTAAQSALAGGLAGACAGFLTSPIELLGLVVRGGSKGMPIGLPQQLHTVASKVGWTAFGGAVFFPCLEAAIQIFDLPVNAAAAAAAVAAAPSPA